MRVYPANPCLEITEDNLEKLSCLLEAVDIKNDLGYVHREFKVEKSDSEKWQVVCYFRSCFGDDKGKEVIAETDNEEYANVLALYNPYMLSKLIEEIYSKKRIISRLEKQMENIIESHITTVPEEVAKIKKYARCNVCPSKIEGEVATYLRDYYNPCHGCTNLK